MNLTLHSHHSEPSQAAGHADLRIPLHLLTTSIDLMDPNGLTWRGMASQPCNVYHLEVCCFYHLVEFMPLRWLKISKYPRPKWPFKLICAYNLFTVFDLFCFFPPHTSLYVQKVIYYKICCFSKRVINGWNPKRKWLICEWWPLNVLLQSQCVLKQSSSSCRSVFIETLTRFVVSYPTPLFTFASIHC